ncbi:HlyD family secretion protein [Serratia odorifera]|uniref:HlyD family secretion protein n=1 Tax=Serratia odorifera TaxID=618 RepID=UPI003D274AF7
MTENTSSAKQPVFAVRRAKPRPRTLAGILLFTLLILAWGIYWWTTGRWMIETDDAYARADIVTLAPRINGYLVAVAVQDNQPVKAGQLLARIDPRDFQAKVELAEAAVAAAVAENDVKQARIANLAARQQQQISLIAEAQAAVRAAAAESNRAALEDRRQHRLARQNISSAQQVESSDADARKTVAQLAQAQARLASQQQALSVLASSQQATEAERDKAKAMLTQAQAILTIARINLASTRIVSPINGTVGEHALRAGQYAETGSPLLSVVPGNTYVVANFKETQIDHMQVDQPAEVRVDAFGGQVFKGKVESFSPASGAQFALLPPDNATGNFTKIVQRMPVRIRLDAGQTRVEQVRPGMSVMVTVDTRHE